MGNSADCESDLLCHDVLLLAYGGQLATTQLSIGEDAEQGQKLSPLPGAT